MENRFSFQKNGYRQMLHVCLRMHRVCLGLQLCLDLNGLHLNEQNLFYPLQIAVKEVFLIVLALEIWGSDMANWKFYLRQIIWRW